MGESVLDAPALCNSFRHGCVALRGMTDQLKSAN